MIIFVSMAFNTVVRTSTQTATICSTIYLFKCFTVICTL